MKSVLCICFMSCINRSINIFCTLLLNLLMKIIWKYVRNKWHKDKSYDLVNCIFRWAIKLFLLIYIIWNIITEAHQETVSSIYGFKVNAEKNLKTTDDQCFPLSGSTVIGKVSFFPCMKIYSKTCST